MEAQLRPELIRTEEGRVWNRVPGTKDLGPGEFFVFPINFPQVPGTLSLNRRLLQLWLELGGWVGGRQFALRR